MLSGLLVGCAGTEEPVQVSEPVITPEPTEQILVSDGAGGTIWIDPAEDLDPFQLDLTQFTVDGDDVSYTGQGYELMRGIDVSDYQGEIDWQAVAEENLDFAIIRVAWRGYGGGSLNEDERCRENIEGALDAGLKVGVYMFSQAISAEEGAEEAEYVLNIIKDYDIELPVFFDWEEVDAEDVRTEGIDSETLTAAALAFADTIEQAGYTPGIYSYLSLYYNTYDLNSFAGMTLWAADPGMWPEFYYDHDYWQYSFEGTISGIDTDVDLDVLFVRTDEDITPIEEGAQG